MAERAADTARKLLQPEVSEGRCSEPSDAREFGQIGRWALKLIVAAGGGDLILVTAGTRLR